MITSKEDLILRKEGNYWTFYIGDIECGCGHAEDQAEVLEEVAGLLDNGWTVEKIIEDLFTEH